jgi:hypothetical protein
MNRRGSSPKNLGAGSTVSVVSRGIENSKEKMGPCAPGPSVDPPLAIQLTSATAQPCMEQHNKQKFGLAPPPCVNSAPMDRGPVRSRFTSDGPDTDRQKFLNTFKTVGPVRQM